jgi:hypothetical protein
MLRAKLNTKIDLKQVHRRRIAIGGGVLDITAGTEDINGNKGRKQPERIEVADYAVIFFNRSFYITAYYSSITLLIW